MYHSHNSTGSKCKGVERDKKSQPAHTCHCSHVRNTMLKKCEMSHFSFSAEGSDQVNLFPVTK